MTNKKRGLWQAAKDFDTRGSKKSLPDGHPDVVKANIAKMIINKGKYDIDMAGFAHIDDAIYAHHQKRKEINEREQNTPKQEKPRTLNQTERIRPTKIDDEDLQF